MITLKNNNNDNHSQCLHSDDLEDIRRDLQDIRTILGIKDITNGEIKRLMKQLGKTTEKEDERLKKGQDGLWSELHNIQLSIAAQQSINKEILYLLRAVIGGFILYILLWAARAVIIGF